VGSAFLPKHSTLLSKPKKGQSPINGPDILSKFASESSDSATANVPAGLPQDPLKVAIFLAIHFPGH